MDNWLPAVTFPLHQTKNYRTLPYPSFCHVLTVLTILCIARRHIWTLKLSCELHFNILSFSCGNHSIVRDSVLTLAGNQSSYYVFQLLFVRHQFKIAFFNELKQDTHTAIKYKTFCCFLFTHNWSLVIIYLSSLSWKADCKKQRLHVFV